MKETKVYINKMPESCWDCFCQDNENGRCKILGKYTDYVPKDCPLIDIKTHDRKLVKEVCERIRKDLSNKFIYFEGKKEYYKISDILEILDHIQKEFEK